MNKITLKKFGEVIYSKRVSMNLSIKDLSNKSGVSCSTISMYEKDLAKTLKYEDFVKIGYVLGLSFDDFMIQAKNIKGRYLKCNDKIYRCDFKDVCAASPNCGLIGGVCYNTTDANHAINPNEYLVYGRDI